MSEGDDANDTAVQLAGKRRRRSSPKPARLHSRLKLPPPRPAPPSEIEKDLLLLRYNWPAIRRALEVGSAVELHQEALALRGAEVFSGTHQMFVDGRWVLSRYNMDPITFAEMWDKMLGEIMRIIAPQLSSQPEEPQ